MMLISEHKNASPSANSIYSRATFQNLLTLAEHFDFTDPIFLNKRKRNRSVGSVQSLIVELALQDEDFIKKLRSFMLYNGLHWKPYSSYADKYPSIPQYNRKMSFTNKK